MQRVKVNRVPVPYYVIDADMMIIEASEAALGTFPQEDRLTDIVDADSLDKAVRFIGPESPIKLFEVNMITSDQPPKLFDLYQNWDELAGVGHIALVKKSKDYQQVFLQLKKLQKNLLAGGTQLDFLRIREEPFRAEAAARTTYGTSQAVRSVVARSFFSCCAPI